MRACLAVLIAAAFLAACQTPEPKPEPPPVTAPAAPPAEAVTPPPAVPAPAPPLPVGPPPGSAEAKAVAQKQALHAAELLQDGDEPAADAELKQALVLDPDNRLAASLSRQISDDPVAVLGRESFAYTVGRGESLSRIAQRFLGDVYQFYILARYNGIRVPRMVQAGQVIRVPGKAPPAAPAATPATAPAAEPPAPEAEPERKPVEAKPAPPQPAPVEQLYQAGQDAEKRKDTRAAYEAYSQAARINPSYRDARAKAESARRELVRQHTRAANTAFHRQDLKTSIAEWDRVLELDPNNETARLNRQRAIDLAKRIEQIK